MIKRLKTIVPDVTFVSSDSFFWSPAVKTIYYDKSALDRPAGVWALLHESAHALLGHHTYVSDLELLFLEVAAWEKAQIIAKDFGLTIGPDHIQDCLDTYRDWLHQRSTCPTCGVVSTQENARTYKCFNCGEGWQVSSSRFCRPYRLSKHMTKNKTLSRVNQTTFQ